MQQLGKRILLNLTFLKPYTCLSPFSSTNNGTFHGNSNNATNTTTNTYTTKTPEQLAAERAAAERERQREEYYATYDVMTGVRIAATLGCFFAFMVFLIAYKSRNKDDGMNVSFGSDAF